MTSRRCRHFHIEYLTAVNKFNVTRFFENRPTFGKVMNEKYRWSFLTHSIHGHTCETRQRRRPRKTY